MLPEHISDPSLDHFRSLGDAPADDLVRLLMDKYGPSYGRTLMLKLTDFKEDLLFKGDPLLSAFYKEYAVKPDFLHKKDLIRATDLYKRYQQQTGIVLACYSLPYCYLAEDGARVLQLSGRIRSDTYNRLRETGNFLRKTMHYDLWESGGIFSVLLKVRLIHALIRYFTLNSGKWDMTWGVPVNQEDMAGTNLSFSFIVLKGLRKLGVSTDDMQERAWLRTWSAVGHILGVHPGLLVNSAKEAFELDKAIARRHFRASETGRELTASLMMCFGQMADSQLFSSFLEGQMRLLLGEKYADWLGIPSSRFPVPVLNALNYSSSFFNLIYN